MCGVLTRIVVTCAGILTSVRSKAGHPFLFIAEQNALLPLTHFTGEANIFNIFNIRLEILSMTIFEKWSGREDYNLLSMQLYCIYKIHRNYRLRPERTRNYLKSHRKIAMGIEPTAPLKKNDQKDTIHVSILLNF